MNPGGKTRTYAVLGHPVAHTLSPVMHNAAFRALGWDALYVAFDVEPDRLLAVLDAMRAMGFCGVNLTVPHKEVAFGGLTDLDASARDAGAVNTVEMTDAGMRGHNTDGYGLLRALEACFGAGVEGQEVVLLGSGGAARGTGLVCARSGVKSLTVVARNAEKAARVVEAIGAAAPGVPVRAVTEPGEQTTAIQAGDLVIQATSVGLKADDPPLFPASAFRSGQRVYDMIYTFPETSTMKAAREAGAQVENGLGMLLHQGVRAFEIWTGETPPVETMREALRKAMYP
jgi:shikimate dehydrogenase